MQIDLTLFFGASIFIFCAFIFQKKQQYTIGLGLLLLGGLFLRIYIGLDNYPHPWDERYHALVAKNLLKNPWVPKLYANPLLAYDYTQWTHNEVWLHKPPLTLWSIAVSFKIFGVSPFAIRIPSIILSTLSIYLLYMLGRDFWNRKIAFLAAFFLTINGLILELVAGRVTTDHIDVHFLFFILLAIVLARKAIKLKSLLILFFMSLVLSCALLTKWLPALVVLPIYGVMFMSEYKGQWRLLVMNMLLISTIVFVIVFPWHYYIHTVFPLEAKWEAEYNFKHLNHVVETHQGSLFFYLHKIRINYGELVYLPIIYFALKVRKFFSLKTAILLWFLIPFLVFSSVSTKMQGYLIISSPALFLMTAWTFYEIKTKGFKYRALAIILMVLLIFLPVRYSVERLKPWMGEDRNQSWVGEIEAFGRDCPKNTVLFNYPYAIEAMFLTDIVAYYQLPSTEILQELQNKNYNIVIFKHGIYPVSEKMEALFERVDFELH
ncbi:ArnT family glycosyltransferase [Lishizhenia sp.]|uniref:ArnT family glycosyltransferase n=1 Tax=Lishizhenia sp. TaxID=2497594 RepID=UPI00299EED9D|nr:glycosyltransferase family 39 protein [Lishizhenia sp.]MDX1447099.1 glycosyltransferase family 39 protein [Lishizhenia sp.]